MINQHLGVSAATTMLTQWGKELVIFKRVFFYRCFLFDILFNRLDAPLNTLRHLNPFFHWFFGIF